MIWVADSRKRLKIKGDTWTYAGNTYDAKAVRAFLKGHGNDIYLACGGKGKPLHIRTEDDSELVLEPLAR